MSRQTICYRGSLKSCNYSCSYCPFSKRKASAKEMERDQSQWMEFCRRLGQYAGKRNIGALLVTPYGEAMIHGWYWKGLAAISRLTEIQAVGAQTNLSFPYETFLEAFQRDGGIKGKLRLWATFHPEMISAERFAEKVRQVWETGVSIGAGAVGVPENLPVLKALREALPQEVYLWINRMDGLKRPYSQEELQQLTAIDPWFLQECAVRIADCRQCQGRMFVEGNGAVGICNISRRRKKGSWYEAESDEMGLDEMESGEAGSDAGEQGAGEPGAEDPVIVRSDAVIDSCGKKYCTCYLAYAGRDDFENRLALGRYPLFRIPWKPKAFFVDLDGMFLAGHRRPGFPVEQEVLGASLLRQMKSAENDSDFFGLPGLWFRTIPVFLVTSLSGREAKRRLGADFSLFQGGVFASGAQLYLKFGEVHCQENFFGNPEEGHWMKVVSEKPEKEQGLAAFCRWLGMEEPDCAIMGDSCEDLPMFRRCGFAIAPETAEACVRKEADWIVKMSAAVQ